MHAVIHTEIYYWVPPLVLWIVGQPKTMHYAISHPVVDTLVIIVQIRTRRGRGVTDYVAPESRWDSPHPDRLRSLVNSASILRDVYL